MRLRVGIDVGGTFTDVTAFDEERGELVAVRKYLSDPAEPAAVMEAITADLARDFGADSVALILHGSTAALNTLLEGRGVKVGLLTTRGVYPSGGVAPPADLCHELESLGIGMQRFADQVVDHVRSVVLRRVDVVDAELDGSAQHGPRGIGVARRPEHPRTGELHRAEAHAVDRLVTQECRRVHNGSA